MLVDIVALREFLYEFELWNRECQLEAKLQVRSREAGFPTHVDY